MKKLLVILAVFSNLSLIGCFSTSDSSADKEVFDNPLIHIANLSYEGAFLFDSGDFGFSTMHDAEGGMAYAPPTSDALNGSIFASGNYAQGGISEWAIPQIVKSTEIDVLNMSEQPLQTFVDITDRAPDRRVEMGYFADLLWLDNQLLYSEHHYYPASNLGLHKLGVLREADDLQGSAGAGYFRVDALSGEESADSYTADASSGWMSEIPEEWQRHLDGTHLIGPADGWNIEGRFAAGPSVFAFNPETDVLSKNPRAIIDSSPLVDYATENPITTIGIVGGGYINAPSDLWNSMSFVHFGFIPKGSRTLMLVGNQWGIDGDIGYKITQDNGEKCGGPCAFNSDDKANYYWLIDLMDVIDAKTGLRRYDSIVPYAYGPLPLPFQQDENGNEVKNDLRGGAYDVTTGTIYLQIKGGDPRPEFELRPVMVAYTIDTDIEYPVPLKPVWGLVDGLEANSTQGPTFRVSCADCTTRPVEINWHVPTTSTAGSSVDVDHFRLHYEKVSLPYRNQERGQRIGVTVVGDITQHVQELSPGEWRITIRAISSDGVPSELQL